MTTIPCPEIKVQWRHLVTVNGQRLPKIGYSSRVVFGGPEFGFVVKVERVTHQNANEWALWLSLAPEDRRHFAAVYAYGQVDNEVTWLVQEVVDITRRPKAWEVDDAFEVMFRYGGEDEGTCQCGMGADGVWKIHDYGYDKNDGTALSPRAAGVLGVAA